MARLLSYDRSVGGQGVIAAVVAGVACVSLVACGGFLGFGDDDDPVVETSNDAGVIDAVVDVVKAEASENVDGSVAPLLPRTATFELGSLTGPQGADETAGVFLVGADGTSAPLRGTSSAKTELDSAAKRGMFFDLNAAPATTLTVTTVVRADLITSLAGGTATFDFIVLSTENPQSYVSIGVAPSDGHVFLQSPPATPQDMGVMSVNGRYLIELKVNVSPPAVEASIEMDGPDPISMEPVKQTWSKPLAITKVELGARGSTAFTYDDVTLTSDPWTP